MNKTLLKKTPKQWLSVIEKIRNPITRIRTACIVWWDYFAIMRNDSSDLLNPYLEAYSVGTSVRAWKIERALLSFGYSKKIAKTRSKDPNQIRRTYLNYKQ